MHFFRKLCTLSVVHKVLFGISLGRLGHLPKLIVCVLNLGNSWKVEIIRTVQADGAFSQKSTFNDRLLKSGKLRRAKLLSAFVAHASHV